MAFAFKLGKKNLFWIGIVPLFLFHAFPEGPQSASFLVLSPAVTYTYFVQSTPQVSCVHEAPCGYFTTVQRKTRPVFHCGACYANEWPPWMGKAICPPIRRRRRVCVPPKAEGNTWPRMPLGNRCWDHKQRVAVAILSCLRLPTNIWTDTVQTQCWTIQLLGNTDVSSTAFQDEKRTAILNSAK